MPKSLFANTSRRDWRDVPQSERWEKPWEEPENWHRLLDAFDWDGWNGTEIASFARVRALLDETYANLLAAVRETVWNRRQNEGTLFELLTCRMLKALGFKVQWEPRLANDKTPDFLVTGPGRPFYVEAFNAGGPGDFEMARNERQARDQLAKLACMEPLKSASFGLIVTWKGTLKRSWGRKTLRRLVIPPLTELVAQCRGLADRNHRDWPTRTVRDGDWSVELKLHPDPERGVDFLSEAKFLTAVRKAEEDLLAKASKYAKLEHPLLLVMALRSMDFASVEGMRRELAWGGLQAAMSPGDAPTEVFHSGGGMLATRASCILCTGINPWQLGRSTAEFWHNANSEEWQATPSGLGRLPGYRLIPSASGQRQGRRQHGEPLPALLGLPVRKR